MKKWAQIKTVHTKNDILTGKKKKDINE